MKPDQVRRKTEICSTLIGYAITKIPYSTRILSKVNTENFIIAIKICSILLFFTQTFLFPFFYLFSVAFYFVAVFVSVIFSFFFSFLCTKLQQKQQKSCKWKQTPPPFPYSFIFQFFSLSFLCFSFFCILFSCLWMCL